MNPSLEAPGRASMRATVPDSSNAIYWPLVSAVRYAGAALCSRVARNVRSGQRSSVSFKLTLLGAR